MAPRDPQARAAKLRQLWGILEERAQAIAAGAEGAPRRRGRTRTERLRLAAHHRRLMRDARRAAEAELLKTRTDRRP